MAVVICQDILQTTSLITCARRTRILASTDIELSEAVLVFKPFKRVKGGLLLFNDF